MNPTVFELALSGDRQMVPGRCMLAAFVPATGTTPALVLAGCDPRCGNGCALEDMVVPTLAHIQAQLGEVGNVRWALVDRWGRFFEALPQWPADPAEPPRVQLRRFPSGGDVEAFIKELGPAGEAGLEMLSAVVEGAGEEPEPASAREFIAAVAAHGNLPAPGALFKQVSTAAVSGDAKGAARAIQLDPVISATLLKYANAAQFAAAKKTASVSEAIQRLGLAQVRRVVFVAEMMARYKSGKCPDFPYKAYWHNAVATGAAMRALLEKFELPSHLAEEAFSAGLLSGIGWLAVAETFPSLMSRYLEQARQADPITKVRLAKEVFPASIRHVSEAYLAGFDLPENVRAAIAGTRNEYDWNWFDCLAAAVRAAQGLAPFECLPVPTTIPVPEACREEWRRWQGLLG
jgi:HD-like signal output (HDOD) protein